ncbi:MAG: ABC transporter permease [Phycisphaerales bacterium]
MQGIGIVEAQGFWADAWKHVLKRKTAVVALCWLGFLAAMAVLAPFLASGHPISLRETLADGTVRVTHPFLDYIKNTDIILLLGVPAALIYIFSAPKPGSARARSSKAAGRAERLGACIVAALLTLLIVVACNVIQGAGSGRDAPAWAMSMAAPLLLVPGLGPVVKGAVFVSIVVFFIGCALPFIASFRARLVITFLACLLAGSATSFKWTRPLESFDYVQREMRGEVQATYTLVPWSPNQRFTSLDRTPPGTDFSQMMAQQGESHPLPPRRFLLGTDGLGQDVLAQLMHASRLSISIGLVSTGIAVLIGVTLGALMGYFGGVVDLLLFRVVEVFMAVPLLFLLIVAAAVLPPEMRSTYVMMAIIGCFTWTGAARFTRAEFMKLRSQDFVQSAKAVGLPLRAILFKHMLPNGVTPVLVDASFAIAAAITIEATLSFLGLGPVDQASWGKMLASAQTTDGLFKWWLAIFPGLAIFLSVLAYNIVGEALRDAIDPKLKKARV